MSIPRLGEEDLVHLDHAFPDLDFSEDELRAVLLANESVDVNAAPGSGKTTVLAAKLYLLSRRWSNRRSGICVISHTNVARDEICRRLALTVEGARLLAYPHFIGTIHGFVNRFLAFPNLVSIGTKVEIVDDEVFARRAWSAAQRSYAYYWLANQPNGEQLAAQLTFSGPDLEIVSRGGTLPRAGKTLDALHQIKRRLATAGCFRFDDMFSFAQNLLANFPIVKDRVSRRFPLVMIDEMQDTSAEQERLISETFDNRVVLQRFGDINQQILADSAGDGRLSFPHATVLGMHTSRRFGRRIAKAVAAVQLSGEPVVGGRDDEASLPTIMLYTPDSIGRVIESFGHLVLSDFPDEDLLSRRVMAVCARRGGNAQRPPGRHVVDYWTTFNDMSGIAVPREESAWHLLQGNPTGTGHLEFRGRVDRVRRVVWVALKQAGADVVKRVKDPSRLSRVIQNEGGDVTRLLRTYRYLAITPSLHLALQDVVAPLIFDAVKDLLPEDIGTMEFSALPVFTAPPDDEAPNDQVEQNTCIVERGGRSVKVGINTIGMTKGETHFSTLVMESFGRSTRFDIAEAQGLLSGRVQMNPRTSHTIKSQYRYLYVGMSRPTNLLCLAMNSDRADTQDLDRLLEDGWRIVSVI